MAESLHICFYGPFTHLPFWCCAMYFDYKVKFSTNTDPWTSSYKYRPKAHLPGIFPFYEIGHRPYGKHPLLYRVKIHIASYCLLFAAAYQWTKPDSKKRVSNVLRNRPDFLWRLSSSLPGGVLYVVMVAFKSDYDMILVYVKTNQTYKHIYDVYKYICSYIDMNI